MSFSTSYICDKRFAEHKRDGQKAKEGKSQSGMDIIMCREKMMKTKAHFHKVMATVKKEKRLV